jgi:hypothetical protein
LLFLTIILVILRGISSSLIANIPSWHAVLSDPGESDIDMFQNFDADMLAGSLYGPETLAGVFTMF